MNAQLAIVLCCLGVAVLFWLDRNTSAPSSSGLWLPILWIAVGNSRVFQWIGIGTPGTLEGTLEGNPEEAALFAVLLLLGILVLVGRNKRVGVFLGVMTPVIIYSIYCLISVAWAYYPVPAFKRWTKDVGDIVMVLIIVTDRHPVAAIRRLFSKVAFLLFPLSVVLIRYTTLGRVWDNDGKLAIIGVTDNKNVLGLVAFVISLGVLWNVRWLFTNKSESNRGRRLVAQCIVLALGLYLLDVAHSSTSRACFALGGGLILATHLRAIRLRPSRVHFLCMAIVLAGGGALLFGGESVANALGRDSNLSGRTFMWAAMFPAVSNPITGVGFDSFWTSPNAEIFHHNLKLLNWYHPEQINEAHNGYIEVYLNLGWIGLCLISSILITGYSCANRIFRRAPEVSSLLLAYIVSGAVYSITEAGFRTLNPMWVCMLLAVITASGVRAGLFGDESLNQTRALQPTTGGTNTGADEFWTGAPATSGASWRTPGTGPGAWA